MPKPRLILHAGTHKTGTTSIQAALKRYRRQLREQGLFYPTMSAGNTTRTAHHGLSRGFASAEAGRRRRAHRFIRKVRAETGTGETVALSSERFYRDVAGGHDWAGFVSDEYWDLRETFLDDLAHALRRFDVDVILYFRDFGYHLAWMHRAVVREGVWEGDAAAFHKAFEDRLDYGAQLDLFRDRFNRVHAFEYETARKDSLIGHFFANTGFAVPEGADQIWKKKNDNSVEPVSVAGIPTALQLRATPRKGGTRRTNQRSPLKRSVRRIRNVIRRLV
ncbi:MAG: hypothetical protein AAGH83_08470 [Pseudomonadota bacterium]